MIWLKFAKNATGRGDKGVQFKRNYQSGKTVSKRLKGLLWLPFYQKWQESLTK
jgi:hypothetical protein